MKIMCLEHDMAGLKSYPEAYAYVREKTHQIAYKSCNLDNWVDESRMIL